MMEEEGNWGILKHILMVVPDFQRFSHGAIGLLYWMCGLLPLYKGSFIYSVKRRRNEEKRVGSPEEEEEDEEEDESCWKFPFFLYKGIARGTDIEQDLFPHYYIE